MNGNLYLAIYQGEDGNWYVEIRQENDNWSADCIGDFPTKQDAVKWAESYAKRNDMGVEVA